MLALSNIDVTVWLMYGLMSLLTTLAVTFYQIATFYQIPVHVTHTYIYGVMSHTVTISDL